jgi:hypothetical protein
MTKTELDKLLKDNAEENKFSVDGDYLVFDKHSNLSYLISPLLKIGDLLTVNPLSNTRINKNLLVAIVNIFEASGDKLNIRSSYQSPEWFLLNFGQADSKLYTSGDAVSIGGSDVDSLVTLVHKERNIKEIGVYDWGVHLGYSKVEKFWDTRYDTSFKQKFKNIILNDKMKNILLLGGAAFAGWWFFLRGK